MTSNQTSEIEVGPGGEVRKEIALKRTNSIPTGRIPLELRVRSGDVGDGCDAFLAADMEK